jgi:hypothetical protein
MITDKLGSYAAAQRQVMPDVEHRSHTVRPSPGRPCGSSRSRAHSSKAR